MPFTLLSKPARVWSSPCSPPRAQLFDRNSTRQQPQRSPLPTGRRDLRLRTATCQGTSLLVGVTHVTMMRPALLVAERALLQ
jgi:DNA-binding helix-hairpin-helix protein with protein kinase domain